MGDIADAMLEGILCSGCGTYLGLGTGSPGYCSDQCATDCEAPLPRTAKKVKSPYILAEEDRARFTAIGLTVHQHDAFHWTVRLDRKVVASWWPHIGKFAMGNGKSERGNQPLFIARLKRDLAENADYTNREQDKSI